MIYEMVLYLLLISDILCIAMRNKQRRPMSPHRLNNPPKRTRTRFHLARFVKSIAGNFTKISKKSNLGIFCGNDKRQQMLAPKTA